MAATSENNLVDIGRELSRGQRSLTVSDLDKSDDLDIGHFKSDQIRDSQLFGDDNEVGCPKKEKGTFFLFFSFPDSFGPLKTK